jgi:Flp pilus assembly pilin Flp
MAETLDLVLVAVAIVGGAALFVYKLVLMYRSRGDPEKLKALVWIDQVFPRRLQRFIYDEDGDEARKASARNSRPN